MLWKIVPQPDGVWEKRVEMAVYRGVRDAVFVFVGPSGDVCVCVDQIIERDFDRSGSCFVKGEELGSSPTF